MTGIPTMWGLPRLDLLDDLMGSFWGSAGAVDPGPHYHPDRENGWMPPLVEPTFVRVVWRTFIVMLWVLLACFLWFLFGPTGVMQ